jgi:hypothetical protein
MGPELPRLFGQGVFLASVCPSKETWRLKVGTASECSPGSTREVPKGPCGKGLVPRLALLRGVETFRGGPQWEVLGPLGCAFEGDRGTLISSLSPGHEVGG